MSFFNYFLKHYIRQQFGVTYILTEIVCCLAISLIFNHLSIKKWQDYLRLLIDWSITWIVQVLLACLVYFILESLDQVSKSRFLIFIVWLLVALLHSAYPNKGSYSKRFTCAIAVATFIVLAVSMSGAFGTLITETVGVPKALYSDWTLYLILVGLIGIVSLFKWLSPFKYAYLKVLPVALVNITFLISYFLNLLEFILSGSEGTPEGNLFEGILYVCLLVMNFLTYIIFYITLKNSNEVIDLQAKALKEESEKNQLAISKAQYEDLHRIRHDLKNQMLFLENLFKEGKYEEMNTYFADLSEKVHVVIDVINSGNMYVNSVLNMELSKAKGAKIPLETSLSVPENLPIDAQDLISLISNVLDNSIEAQIKANSDSPICFSMLYDKNYLFIRAKNIFSISEDKDKIKSLVTSKEDRLSHGFGTKIIKEITSKYNGASTFRTEGNYFIYSGMLYLPMKGEEK